MCECVCNYSSQTTELHKKLYQQIERLTLIAISYSDLKYLPSPYLPPTIFKTPKKPFLEPRNVKPMEIEDSCKAHSNINMKIFAVYGSNDVVQPKDGPFRG